RIVCCPRSAAVVAQLATGLDSKRWRDYVDMRDWSIASRRYGTDDPAAAMPFANVRRLVTTARAAYTA
ncbi:MAG: hypothetical protein ACR2NR_08460, partial [Solirubrobacteraceae bacterium]